MGFAQVHICSPHNLNNWKQIRSLEKPNKVCEKIRRVEKYNPLGITLKYGITEIKEKHQPNVEIAKQKFAKMSSLTKLTFFILPNWMVTL